MAGSGFQPARCRFLGSAPRVEAAPSSGLPEVAIGGRSNVGKSSLINFLLGRKGVARTSSTPGRTQLMNFFAVDERLVLVDLPGYGYARAPREKVRRWLAGVEGYVRSGKELRGVVMLLDVRREPSADDRAFAGLVRSSERTLLAVVTKADKVPRGQRQRRLAGISEALGVSSGELVVTSAKEGLGRQELWRRILEMAGGFARDSSGAAPVRVVAVDGPSGAGKSTVARLLASRLGWTHIDTGAMYRAIGLKADRAGVALDDDPALESLCRRTRVELSRREDGGLRVLLDGEDVSEAVREHRVSDLASRVSARKPVREAMARYQRELGLVSPSVLEGRDIGTVVFPDAFLKVFLTASDDERAGRRARELEAKGEEVDRSQILRDIRRRDENDSRREHAPLRKAEGALLLDTTGMTVDEVVERLAGLVALRLGGPGEPVGRTRS